MISKQENEENMKKCNDSASEMFIMAKHDLKNSLKQFWPFLMILYVLHLMLMLKIPEFGLLIKQQTKQHESLDWVKS